MDTSAQDFYSLHIAYTWQRCLGWYHNIFSEDHNIKIWVKFISCLLNTNPMTWPPRTKAAWFILFDFAPSQKETTPLWLRKYLLKSISRSIFDLFRPLSKFWHLHFILQPIMCIKFIKLHYSSNIKQKLWSSPEITIFWAQIFLGSNSSLLLLEKLPVH